MARATFGGTADDFVYTATSGGIVRLTPATLTVWDAETGGTQITDLLLDGNPATYIAVGADGMVPDFQGPDGVYELWASANDGPRVKMQAATDDARTAGNVLNPGSATAQALRATYVTFVRSDTGAPIPGGHITVKVDPSTHEIVDIIWEA